MSKGFDNFIAEMRAKDPNFAPRKIINKLRAAWCAGKKAGQPCDHIWKRGPGLDPVYTCSKCGEEA